MHQLSSGAARGLQSVRKLPKNILKHLGIAHKILRYKVKNQKQKIIKKNIKCRKNILALEAE